MEALRENPKTTNHVFTFKPPSPTSSSLLSSYKEAKVSPYKPHQLEPIIYTTAPPRPDEKVKDMLELGGDVKNEKTEKLRLGSVVEEFTKPDDIGKDELADEKTEKLLLRGSDDDMEQKVEEQTTKDFLNGHSMEPMV